jgi:phosphoribosylformylglycinamidine (FGAM) synthase-like amidotransferase family enzyme
MPHPEHAVRELVGGSADGLAIFESIRRTVAHRVGAVTADA